MCKDQFKIFYQNDHHHNYSHDKSNQKIGDKQDKGFSVIETDTIIDPGTVVVHI